MGGGRWEVGGGMWGVGVGRWEVGDGGWEVGGGRWEMGGGRWEVGDGGGGGGDIPHHKKNKPILYKVKVVLTVDHFRKTAPILVSKPKYKY